MRINHNIQALNAYRNLSKNQLTSSKHMEKLSSGLRINRASDDAAGLAISEKMRTQIRGLAAAERNSMDGISLVQTAEGALDSVHAMLQRMRELAVQAANDTATENDRKAIQDEINQLTSEINRIGNTIEFNTQKLLDGSISVRNFDGTGRLMGGAVAITGSKASGSLAVGTAGTTGTVTASSYANSTDLNGYRIIFGVDSNAVPSNTYATGTGPANATTGAVTLTGAYTLDGYTLTFAQNNTATFGESNITVSTSSKTISIAADWTNAGSGTAPAAFADIETELNKKLVSSGLGPVTLGKSLAGFDATEFSGDSITISYGTTSNVAAAIAGRDITVTADWNNTAYVPTNLAQIQAAINTALLAEGMGTMTLSANGTTFTASEFENKGTITLTGGITAVAAQKATQKINVAALANEGDVLSIDNKKIAFWDSSKTTYADGATAKAALGADEIIDIYNGINDKEASDIAYEIGAITGFANVDVKVADTGSDLIITAKVAGDAGNNYRSDYIPTTEAGLDLQIGANTGQKLVIDIPNIRSQSLKITGLTSEGVVTSIDGKSTAHYTKIKTVNNGVDSTANEYALDVSTHENAAGAISIFDDALNRVSDARSKLGAYQNRLEYTVTNLTQTQENVTAAESRIRDADMAMEMTEFTKSNIINQAATAMLAQANQLPQGVLQLLK